MPNRRKSLFPCFDLLPPLGPPSPDAAGDGFQMYAEALGMTVPFGESRNCKANFNRFAWVLVMNSLRGCDCR